MQSRTKGGNDLKTVQICRHESKTQLTIQLSNLTLSLQRKYEISTIYFLSIVTFNFLSIWPAALSRYIQVEGLDPPMQSPQTLPLFSNYIALIFFCGNTSIKCFTGAQRHGFKFPFLTFAIFLRHIESSPLYDLFQVHCNVC